MIPKKIHYVWMGKGTKNELISKCIESWKFFLPDYEIIEWNEDNFDINSNKFIKEAYENKKWAFVSDYIRLKVLYEHGGIYFDTDVEVIRSFDELLNVKSFIGFEDSIHLGTSVIAAEKKHRWIGELINYYSDQSIFNKSGNIKLTPNVVHITSKTVEIYKLKLNNTSQNFNDELVVYNSSYFSPGLYSESKKSKMKKIKKQTYSIHHYDGSWLSKKDEFKILAKKLVGYNNINRLKKILKG